MCEADFKVEPRRGGVDDNLGIFIEIWCIFDLAIRDRRDKVEAHARSCAGDRQVNLLSHRRVAICHSSCSSCQSQGNEKHLPHSIHLEEEKRPPTHRNKEDSFLIVHLSSAKMAANADYARRKETIEDGDEVIVFGVRFCGGVFCFCLAADSLNRDVNF